jgi:uncharacterized protein (TIGR00266 family)
VLKVWLEPGEEIWAEPGAFIYGRGRFKVSTTSGGILRGIMRALAGGESFFLNRFEAEGSSELWFAPPLPGDIASLRVTPTTEWVVQDSSYLAHYGRVDVSTAWRGLRGLLAEGELVWLKLSGDGIAWVNAFGAIERVEVPPGEEVVIDNFHFVAMNADASYSITRLGGLKTLMFGGEGFVVKVRGPATVYIQTRMIPELARILHRYMPAKR